MKAIILSGGKGSRLRSVISNLPKPLAPIQGEPFLFILIRFLRFHKISEMIVSTHHHAEKFREILPDLEKMFPAITLLEEPEPLGTGGAVKFACKSLRENEFVLVLNGDTFFDFDLSAFQKKYSNRTALALRKVEDSSRYGTVDFQDGLIKSFLEKAPLGRNGVIYGGYSILNVGDVLRTLPNGESSLERDFFPGLLQQGKTLHGEIFPGKFIDIGIPEDYQYANTEFEFSTFQARTKA